MKEEHRDSDHDRRVYDAERERGWAARASKGVLRVNWNSGVQIRKRLEEKVRGGRGLCCR